MGDFISHAANYPSKKIDWLASQQEFARLQWLRQTFPNKKTENWKYTSLKSLETASFYQPSTQLSLPESTIQKIQSEDIDSLRLVLIDGKVNFDLSSKLLTQNELDVCTFSNADDETQQEIIAHLGSVLNCSKQETHPFAILNSSKFEDGVFLKVRAGKSISEPIELIYIDSTSEHSLTSHVRVFVLLESNSEATLIERFLGNAQTQSFTNSLLEIKLGHAARLFHYRLHEESEINRHIGGVHCYLNAKSHYESFHMALGSLLVREDIVVHHKGEGAHCGLNGVYLPQDNNHIDYHTTIEHAVPKCTTSENFRGIIGDSARAVFNGRIHIHPDAQKTLAQLSNKNLLTSTKAEIDTKPELEIYADDVQCAHGATVAQLDESSLHYMKTRGISESEAKVMLSFGFINELINQIPHNMVIDMIRPKLVQRFGKDNHLVEHIER